MLVFAAALLQSGALSAQQPAEPATTGQPAEASPAQPPGTTPAARPAATASSATESSAQSAATASSATQPSNPPLPPAADQPIDTVIVTGTALRRRTFEAAYAHSTLSAQQIERFAPLSTVDMMGKLAGFVTEASGGESGNNINVRGLPVTNFLFVPLLQDGLPIFQESQEAFLNADELNRVDLMVEQMEAVRGGTSPIYSSNAPGATVNLITRKGTAQRHGAVRATLGDYGLARFDGHWAGPAGQGWLLSVGGYYRIDDGLRAPGFRADRGGQLRINLTRTLRDGELTVYAHRLDDRTIFYLPIPLADPRNPARSLSHLLDPLEGTLTSNDFRHVRIRTHQGTASGINVDEDLAEGIHPRVTVIGASLERRLAGGWTLQNKTRYTDGSVKFNALFSLTPPQDEAAFRSAQLGRAQAGFGPAVTRLQYVLANPRGANGARVPFDPASTDGLVVQGGWWSVNSDFSNFINDLRLTKAFSGMGAGSHALTGGLYVSSYKFEQRRLFNTMLLEMRNRPRALDLLALDNAGNTLGSVTDHGFISYVNNADLGGQVNGRLWALYMADEWTLNERLRLDVGARRQHTRHSGFAIGRNNQNLGDPSTLADDVVGGASGSLLQRRERFSATAWTVGANYDVTPAFGSFVRYTASFRTPALANIYVGATQPPVIISRVKQAEIGTKHRFARGAAYATLFWNRFNPLQDSALTAQASGQVVSTRFISTTQNYGLELEGHWRLFTRLELAGNLTLQNPRYKNLSDLNTGQAIPGVEGNQIRRFPKMLASFSPTYDVALLGRRGKAYATLFYQSMKFVDSNNSTRLPSYMSLDAGLLLDVNHHLRLQVTGSNLTNEIGLTEGNPRTDPLAGQGTTDAIYARPNFGRTLRLSLTYHW